MFTTEIADGFCQTDSTFNNVSIGVMTDNVIISTASTTTNKMVETPEKTIIKLGLNKAKSFVKTGKVQTPSLSTNVLKEGTKSSTTKIPPGKQLNLNCLVKLDRIFFDDIYPTYCSLDQLPRIPFKTYIERGKNSGTIQQSSSSAIKRPLLVAHLTDTCKDSTIKEQKHCNDTSSTASKRKISSDQEEKDETQKKINNTNRDTIENLVGALKKLIDTDVNIDSFSNQDDLKAWCLTKAIENMKDKNK